MSKVEKIKALLSNKQPMTGLHVYFIGIGGIGMSSIARFFLKMGASVAGYDKTPSTLTSSLIAEGAQVHFEDSLTLLDKEADIVVYTPAVPADMLELNYYRNADYPVVKRSDILGWISEATFNICVGGTHGKSTTTTMIAHILQVAGKPCKAFLGGIASNYNTNFIGNGTEDISVIEADEYDRSFHKLSPNVAAITAMDADHLDIYGTLEAVEEAFVLFSKKIRPDGTLFYKNGLAKAADLVADHKYSYAFNDVTADWYVSDLHVENGNYVYDLHTPDEIINNVTLSIGGLHNIENAVVACAAAKAVGVDNQSIKKALASFKGVKRRFEKVLEIPGHVLIDDYAHHPEELKALIEGVRSLYKEKITLVFQPHLFSRTKDLSDGFAKVLDLADSVLLLPIYPARELPMEGVSSSLILDKMQLSDKQNVEKEALVAEIQKRNPGLLVMCGAGDIDLLLPEVAEVLNK